MSGNRAIFNPLTALASADPEMVAQASVQNIDIGVCPKCNEQMIRAVIANNEEVFYCEADRVSTPLPDDLCRPLV